MNLIRSDRTVRVLFLAIILIIIMGSLRPNTTSGMYEKRFWVNKISWQNYADVVIIGDSRTLLGISPAQMQKILKNRQIVNYAFGVGNIYLSEYLDSVEGVLKQESDRKTIILGITPHSLSDDPDFTSQFFMLKNLSKQEIFIDVHFAAIIDFFEYMSFHDALLGISPGLASSKTHRDLFSDGWLAYGKNPPGKKNELKEYLRIYERCQVSPKMIENIMSYISRWNKSGIRVYGFLLPTCTQMVELEKELSGFNQAEFIKAFEKAGGIWIKINPAGYESFDGSHLQWESALRLSRELASRIDEIESENSQH